MLRGICQELRQKTFPMGPSYSCAIALWAQDDGAEGSMSLGKWDIAWVGRRTKSVHPPTHATLLLPFDLYTWSRIVTAISWGFRLQLLMFRCPLAQLGSQLLFQLSNS